MRRKECTARAITNEPRAGEDVVVFRGAIVVGKHHPDIYSALTELQKEQADTESMVVELCLGKKVRALPMRKWVELQERIQSKDESNVYT